MNELTDAEAARLIEYVDGEMDADAMQAFEAELQDNPRLQEALDELRGAVDVIGALGAPEEVDLAEGVRSRIRRRSRGRYFGRRSLYRERVQTQLFISFALAVLAAAILLASPYVIRELFAPQEFELVDEGSGEAEHGGSGEAEGSADNGDVRGPETTGDPSPAPDPTGAEPLPMDGSLARHGAVADIAPTAVRHHEFAYTVRTELGVEALGARLRDQFGAEDVRRDGDAFVVAVPRAQVAETVTRVGDLGPVTRRTVEVPGARATLDITFLPRQ